MSYSSSTLSNTKKKEIQIKMNQVTHKWIILAQGFCLKFICKKWEISYRKLRKKDFPFRQKLFIKDISTELKVGVNETNQPTTHTHILNVSLARHANTTLPNMAYSYYSNGYFML